MPWMAVAAGHWRSTRILCGIIVMNENAAWFSGIR